MRTVANILARKGNNVVKVTPDTSVIDALKIMAEKNIGAVMVMENETFMGIMTERDYSRKIALMGRSSEQTTVADIMTADYPYASPSDTIAQCMQEFSNRNIRYLPVQENGKVTGIVSINDVVTETIQSQSETISFLQTYIHS